MQYEVRCVWKVVAQLEKPSSSSPKRHRCHLFSRSFSVEFLKKDLHSGAWRPRMRDPITAAVIAGSGVFLRQWYCFFSKFLPALVQ